MLARAPVSFLIIDLFIRSPPSAAIVKISIGFATFNNLTPTRVTFAYQSYRKISRFLAAFRAGNLRFFLTSRGCVPGHWNGFRGNAKAAQSDAHLRAGAIPRP